jgi:transcriptional regulator with XRE-family HTH domain
MRYISADTDNCFGFIIKQARESRKLTQEKLAELVGVDYRTIQRWEAEECIPWPVYVEKLIVIMPEIEQELRRAIKKMAFFINLYFSSSLKCLLETMVVTTTEQIA